MTRSSARGRQATRDTTACRCARQTSPVIDQRLRLHRSFAADTSTRHALRAARMTHSAIRSGHQPRTDFVYAGRLER